MLGMVLSRYRTWILKGPTRDQREEIRTALREMRCSMFIVYQKGRPVDIYWCDRHKRLTKPTTKPDVDAWQSVERVVRISRPRL